MAGGEEQDMTCRELVELVTDYLEGALPPHDRLRFEMHLAECAYCVQYLEQVRKTIEVLGELPGEPVAPAERELLVAAFRGWRGA
jgi:anti-sigma factor RsiW